MTNAFSSPPCGPSRLDTGRSAASDGVPPGACRRAGPAGPCGGDHYTPREKVKLRRSHPTMPRGCRCSAHDVARLEVKTPPGHHPASDTPGGRAGDHPYPSRRRPDRRAHRRRHHAPVPGSPPTIADVGLIGGGAGKVHRIFRRSRKRPLSLTGVDARLAAKIAWHNFCIWFDEQFGGHVLPLRISWPGNLLLSPTNRSRNPARCPFASYIWGSISTEGQSCQAPRASPFADHGLIWLEQQCYACGYGI